LKIFGWKIDVSVPQGVLKAVVVMAPHTSNWDFVIGRLAFYLMNVRARFLIKKELFFFPLGFILRRLGAIPIDRKSNNNMVQQAEELFANYESLYLVFTPEGSRSANPNWKKGFYFIAQNAKVPIVLAYIDYRKKTGGFHDLFNPSGNVKQDILDIKHQLAQYHAKYPEKGIIF
jgi:1-acyl-sn-glycerol-3-phosphate acyltransferase